MLGWLTLHIQRRESAGAYEGYIQIHTTSSRLKKITSKNDFHGISVKKREVESANASPFIDGRRH